MDIITKFIEVKGEKLSIPKEDIEKIIVTLFKFLKGKINDPSDFREIRIKYFGSFQIFRGALKGVINKEVSQYKKGYRKEEEHEKLMKILTKLLEDYDLERKV